MCHSFYVFELHKTKTILHQFFAAASSFHDESFSLYFSILFFSRCKKKLERERSSENFSFHFFSGNKFRLVDTVEPVGICTGIITSFAR